MRLGIDLGGTKTEIIALDEGGDEIYRRRVPSDNGSYGAVIATISNLVLEAETALGRAGTLGIGIPGIVSARTGRVKNANTTILNGQALDRDLAAALDREVRCANDANCLAVSESIDGAGAGHEVVFAAILGTGCGAGLSLRGSCWAGHNLVAGEWGHNPLPWMTESEYPGHDCWCGLKGCIETWISGTGFVRDYARHAGAGDDAATGAEIVARAQAGEDAARAALDRYIDRLGRCLAHVVNMLDPDVIVLGGGMSNVDALYERVPSVMARYVFGGEADTPVLKNRHGDSSGVRGAAWLWS